MAEMSRMTFCTECRQDVKYELKKKTEIKTIRNKEYHFTITTAFCPQCGGELGIAGLMDQNVREIDRQYRRAEDIVTTDDIEKLMQIYKIGKNPLSLVLGFGEITVTRYLAGQVPSKEYSEIIRTALTNPAYMKALLIKNREKIAPAAYHKAITAASELENLFAVSDKTLRTIHYIFEALEEVTPLMLQKLLYFVQGIYLALYDRPLLEEDCEAWIHGPVYPKVYNLFRDFRYNPIDDARFSVLDGTSGALTPEERKVIDLAVRTFGLYSGKVLERITHSEKPWQEARGGYADTIPSTEIISKDAIQIYYKAVNTQYPLATEEGIRAYIHAILGDSALTV